MIPKFPKWVFIDDSSLQRENVDNVLKSEMEVGPAKTRPIQSVPMFRISANISYCLDSDSQWRSWWRSIGFGSYWFILPDPFDGTKRRFRFVDTNIIWVKQGKNMSTSVILEAYDEL